MDCAIMNNQAEIHKQKNQSIWKPVKSTINYFKNSLLNKSRLIMPWQYSILQSLKCRLVGQRRLCWWAKGGCAEEYQHGQIYV
jgi:hypothetical protein